METKDNTNYSIPQQRISIAKKGETWKRNNLDYWERLSFNSPTGYRTSNLRKLINYDLFNGKFDRKDLEYVCNPIVGSSEEFPATLQHYDIISPAIMLLLGEESKRPDNFIVVSEGPDAVNRKQEKIKQRVLQTLNQHLMAEIDPSTVDPNNPPQTPEQVLKYSHYNIPDMIESKANKMLKVLKKRLNTKLLFNKGWKDSLIAGEEIYWTGISNGEPIVRRCNPPDITVVFSQDSDFIDDSIAVVETRIMTIPAILEELGDLMTPAQIKDLENTLDTGFAAMPNLYKLTLQNGAATDTGTRSTSYERDGLKVVRVEWLSMEKVGSLTYTDENQIPQEELVDETFKLDIFKIQYPDAQVEWFWRNVAWEGTKIGNDIYVGIQPKPNQRRRMDNPYYTRLGYSGLVYNATNSISVSLIDRLKPYQYLYNILMYRLELAFASDMGKIFLMDLSQIPRSEGISVEKWMYYLKAMKIGFINSFEEGKGKFTGQRSAFNQFQSIDLTLANTIQQYINSLDFIKQQIAYLSGISPQRLGAIQSNELVGNVERAVNQSALITEYWFEAHNEVKQRVYTALLECAKLTYIDGFSAQFVMDDMSIEPLIIEQYELENCEFSVFVSNSSKDHQVIQELKSLFQVALQSDKATLSDIATILETDSISDLKHKLMISEENAFERQQQAQQQQLESQEKIQQTQIADKEADRQLKREEMDRNDINEELDRQNKIEVETIKALGYAENTDVNQNLIPDVMEQSKLALQQTKQAFDQSQKQKELEHKKETEIKKTQLKEKELKSKQEIERLKIKQTEIQNKSQEKIAKKQAELKEKELQIKKKQISKQNQKKK